MQYDRQKPHQVKAYYIRNIYLKKSVQYLEICL